MNYLKFIAMIATGILLSSTASAQEEIRGTFVGADPTNTEAQEGGIFFSPFNAAGLWFDQSGNEGAFDDFLTLNGGNTASSTTGTGGYNAGIGDVDIVTTISNLGIGESYLIDFIHTNSFGGTALPYSVGFSPTDTSQVGDTTGFEEWLVEDPNQNVDGQFPARAWSHEVGTATADENGEIKVYVNLLPEPDAFYPGFAAYNGVAFSAAPQTLVGDLNDNGVVDCDDIDEFIGNLGSPAAGMTEFDLVADGTIDSLDVALLVETLVVTSNGETGTALGDLNCDGQVNVLGDAFILVANLGFSNNPAQ